MGFEVRFAEFGKHHLFERAGTCVGFKRKHARQNFPWRDDVTDTERWRDRLRKRPDMHDTAGLAHGVNRGRTLSAPDQIRITIVLEDRHAVFFGELQQLAPPLLAHDRRGRILHCRDRVDELRPHAARLQIG